MSGQDSVLIVAFDGMDYELMKDFDLDILDMEEVGKIDNCSGINSRYTSELFASFITGETWENHGIVKLVRSDRSLIKRKLRQGLIPDFLVSNVRGFWRLNRATKRALSFLLRIDTLKYDKHDLERDTIFEEIDLSKPLFVPSYNPDLRWQLNIPHKMAEVGERSSVREYSKKLTSSRLEELHDLSFDFWNLIMIHLHDPDAVQDLSLGEYRQDYERLDSIAQDILERTPEGWTVIFMSDHGMMEEKQHNKNAFYASNRELFGDRIPHITDFYEKILYLVNPDS